MAKQELLEFKGKVKELLPNAMFRVTLENKIGRASCRERV